jgi:hypothetical protein
MWVQGNPAVTGRVPRGFPRERACVTGGYAAPGLTLPVSMMGVRSGTAQWRGPKGRSQVGDPSR